MLDGAEGCGGVGSWWGASTLPDANFFRKLLLFILK